MPRLKVIGLHSCKEALKNRSPKELKNLYLKENWQKSNTLKELARLAQAKKLHVQTLSLKKIKKLLSQRGGAGWESNSDEAHQGILLELEHSFDSSNFKWSFGESDVVLILDRIQDPKNLGAILRTAWLMGVVAVFVSRRHSAPISAVVIKTACGALEHVPVFIEDNLMPTLNRLKKLQFWIYALDPQSKKNLWSEKLEGRQAFVLGSEASGLKKSLKNQCDEFLRIPQKEASASYNVSVATAMVLSESLRQKAQA